MNAQFDDLVVTKWGARFQGRSFPCAVGRGGIGKKGGEGDGITPIGVFQIMGCGYRPDRIDFDAPNIECNAISITDVWSDDPKDPEYNHQASLRAHEFSHEKLRRSDPLYDVFVILDYNYPIAVPGKGSAIFLHKWRKPGHPTEGCIAFSERDLIGVLARWQPKSRVIIRG